MLLVCNVTLPGDQREVWVDVGYWTIFFVSDRSWGIILSDAWPMYDWSAIPEFYYLMWFFNLVLKLCLYCRKIIPFLFYFCFWSRFLTFLLLIPFNSIKKLFLYETLVEEDKKNIWAFKLLTLNSLSQTILCEGG